MSERSATLLIIMVVAFGLLLALIQRRESGPPQALDKAVALTPEMVPLVTGEEPITVIFTKAGCPVCHTIPGIPGAEGRVGPPLWLGTTGAARLVDPAYRGRAKTIREYVVESVVEPGVYVVPGYPASTMPTWYGAKLSALALEKISAYLEPLQAPASL